MCFVSVIKKTTGNIQNHDVKITNKRPVFASKEKKKETTVKGRIFLYVVETRNFVNDGKLLIMINYVVKTERMNYKLENWKSYKSIY